MAHCKFVGCRIKMKPCEFSVCNVEIIDSFGNVALLTEKY